MARNVGMTMIVSSRVSNATIREAIPALYTDEWSGPVDRSIIVGIQRRGNVKDILVDDDDIHNEHFSQDLPPNYRWITLKYGDDGKLLPTPLRTLVELPSVPLRVTKEDGIWKYGDAPEGRKVDDDLNTNTDFLIQYYSRHDKESDALNVLSKRGFPTLPHDVQRHIKELVHSTRNDHRLGRGRKRSRKQMNSRK